VIVLFIWLEGVGRFLPTFVERPNSSEPRVDERIEPILNELETRLAISRDKEEYLSEGQMYYDVDQEKRPHVLYHFFNHSD
jgi:hypothetical protein